MRWGQEGGGGAGRGGRRSAVNSPAAHTSVPPHHSSTHLSTTGSPKSGLLPTFLVYTRTRPCAGGGGGGVRWGMMVGYRRKQAR